MEFRKKRGREEERGNISYHHSYGVEQKCSDLYRQQKIAKHLHRRSDFNDRSRTWVAVASSTSSQTVATTVAAAHAAAAAAHYGGSAASRGGGGGGGGGTGAASSIAVAPAPSKPIGKSSKHSGSSGTDGDYQLVQVRSPFHRKDVFMIL